MWLTSRINYQTVGALDRRDVGATDTGLIVIGCQMISSAQTLRINNIYFGYNDIFFHQLSELKIYIYILYIY